MRWQRRRGRRGRAYADVIALEALERFELRLAPLLNDRLVVVGRLVVGVINAARDQRTNAMQQQQHQRRRRRRRWSQQQRAIDRDWRRSALHTAARRLHRYRDTEKTLQPFAAVASERRFLLRFSSLIAIFQLLLKRKAASQERITRLLASLAKHRRVERIECDKASFLLQINRFIRRAVF